MPLRRTVIVALLFIVFLGFVQSTYLVPDSAGYLAYARSLLWDGDVDFTNDYARLGTIEREAGIEFGAPTLAGRPGNPFGIGAALLWLPFIAVTAGAAGIARSAGAGVATDGFGTATLWAAQLGTWTYALAALALMASMLRIVFEGDAASRRMALVGAFLGTPVLYYIMQMPSYSHVCAMFAVSLLVYLSVRWQATWTVRRAIILGAALGLGGLVRIQGLGFWPLPLMIGWWGGALRPSRVVRLAALYSLAAFVVFLPQVAAWTAIYGTVGRIPQGSGFLHASARGFWDVLFASRHGLVAWSPIVLGAFVGWALLIRSPATRLLGIASVSVFVIQWVVNSLPIDWWAGWSFGARRFIACVPVLAIGLVALGRASDRSRTLVYALVGANLLQWLRVTSGALSGETDPGWSGLWGADFWASISRAPRALWELLEVPWDKIHVLRRATSVAPSLQRDPPAFLLTLYAAWAVLIVAIVSRRWWRRRAPGPS